jgi:Phosphotransferase enzyme family/Phosphodiester glycosidase
VSLPLPGLSIPLGEWAERHCLASVGRIRHIDRVHGGNVSHVFRLWGDRGTLILKVRQTTLARIPQFRTAPAVVGVEARAVELFRASLPGEVPMVVAVNPERGELLLEDFGVVSLASQWAERGVTEADVRQFGDLAGRLHRATASVMASLRPDGDDATRTHLVTYCLRQSGVAALDAAADRCLAEPAHLVHGDLAPKNVLVRGGGLAVCDLEGAHHGSTTLDMAYSLAHVLLHSAPAADIKQAMAATFLGAYAGAAAAAAAPDPDLLVPCLVGVLLYRLLNQGVPYDLAMDAAARRQAAERLAAVVQRWSPSVPAVCSALAGGTAPAAQATARHAGPVAPANAPPIAALPASVLRCRQQADGSVVIGRPSGTSVIDPDLLARDQRAFAVRVGASAMEPAPGVSVTSETVELADDRFTNLYELRASLDKSQLVLWSAARGSYLRDQLGVPGTVAAVSGSFSFISDDPSYAPVEPCFDLCVREGMVASLPTSDKPALLVRDGVAITRRVRARGRLVVGGLALRWVGSKSCPHPGAPVPGTVAVYGAANSRIRYAAAERTGFYRYVPRAENVTRPDGAVVDAVVRQDNGYLVIAEICPGGGADLFTGAFVLRFRPPVPARVRPGCPVEITAIDDLDCGSISSALSVGPSVADAASGDIDGYDDFLGNAPFRADGRYARALVGVDEGEVALQVFDGAPLTRQFQGPTPGEVREIVSARGHDPARVFHLDGGGSAKMVVDGGGELVALGSLHYLRWPQRPSQAFEWRGLHGRRLHSAICVRLPGLHHG